MMQYKNELFSKHKMFPCLSELVFTFIEKILGQILLRQRTSETESGYGESGRGEGGGLEKRMKWEVWFPRLRFPRGSTPA